MNIVRGALVCVGLLCIVCSILLGVVFYYACHPTVMEAEMTMIKPTEMDARGFDTKVGDLQRAISEAKPGDEVYLVITQEEATSKIFELLTKVHPPAEVQSVCVNFVNGKILALAKIDVGIVVSLGLAGTIEIDEATGKPRISIDYIDIGKGADLPAGVREQVASLVPSKDALTDYLASLPIRFSKVIVGNGQLIIRGIVLPNPAPQKPLPLATTYPL